ncbi:MAG: DUF4365 domain-containing protein [Chloroflexi bacterium]|nr:DUF4365 domain-containing protein [Chloroflexota bacterium]
MKKLPQRPRSHVLEAESIMFVKQILPMEWVISERKTDYGVDLEVEIVENSNVTGAHFLMQLKSTDKLIVNKKGFISHSCNTSTLQYYLERSELVIYLIYDSKNNAGYWVWIKDFLNNQPSQAWKNQEEFTVKISNKNLFNSEAIEKIKRRVFKSHAEEKLISKVRSLDHPNFKYNLLLDEDVATVTVLPKFPGTAKDIPLSVNLGLTFDDSPEGKKALRDWNDLFKKGKRARIDARFIDKISTLNGFGPEVFFGEDFELADLEVEPLRSDIRFPARIEILDSNNLLIDKWNFIQFEEVRHGTDEAEFSNEDQNTFLVFSIIFNFLEKSSKLSCKPRLKKHKVSEVKEALLFQKNFSKGHFLRLVNLKTDSTLLKISIPQTSFFTPPEEIVEFAEKLSFLEEVFHINFDWPENIKEENIFIVDDLINIVKTGRSFEGDTFEFSYSKAETRKLVDILSNKNLSQLMFVGRDDRLLTLFGKEINLGKVRVLLPEFKPTYETAKIFETLDTWSENLPVKIVFEVSNPGTIIEYVNWMPTK